MITVKYLPVEVKFQILSFIKYSWYLYIQDQIEESLRQQDFIQLYKWNLRLKVFIRDFISPSRDLLLPKLSKLPESYEDEELAELFLIYYYDFYE